MSVTALVWAWGASAYLWHRNAKATDRWLAMFFVAFSATQLCDALLWYDLDYAGGRDSVAQARDDANYVEGLGHRIADAEGVHAAHDDHVDTADAAVKAFMSLFHGGGAGGATAAAAEAAAAAAADVGGADEAAAHIFLNDEPQCSPLNLFVTKLGLPIVLALEPLANAYGAVMSGLVPKAAHKAVLLCAAVSIVCVVTSARGWGCTTVSPQGHLRWGGGDERPTPVPTLFFLAVLTMPFIWLRPMSLCYLALSSSLLTWAYGYYTDAFGSNWCFAASWLPVPAILA